MKTNTVPPAAGATRLKSEDDREFKARWIPFGMRLKARADAFGIDWRELDLENYIAAIQAAEKWAQPEGVQDA